MIRQQTKQVKIMPKLEIANNNRYSHRRIEEVPRWDRWDTRMPDVKDQLRAIDLYNKSGAVSKSDFVRARILGESFKVITVDKSAVEYYRKLSELTAQVHSPHKPNIPLIHSILCYKLFANICKFFCTFTL